MSAGTAERFRPDYDKYVAFDKSHHHSLIGKPFSRRFPNEYWLNLKNGNGQRDFVLAGSRLAPRSAPGPASTGSSTTSSTPTLRATRSPAGT